jgi:hypothetical protein
MGENKDWDWTIEATDNGFYFFEMKCVPEFGGGRFTKEETELASNEFSKIDNPDVSRTREEGMDLINKIKLSITNIK